MMQHNALPPKYFDRGLERYRETASRVCKNSAYGPLKS